ncbi:MAG TPA: ATP-binding protein [Candidatus Nanoarchaeia archaeon]|nr:ATP-binding protein [Candidatus Nanoarchaeia archaeon]
MEKEKLRQVLTEQNKFRDGKLVPRELIRKIDTFEKTPFIIIVSGIRRAGKSTLLHELRAKRRESYYVNFDDDRLIDFHVDDFQTMYELLIELFGKKNTFFFDEIQNINSWERFVRRLNDNGSKVFITGSNASMLSKDLGTHLTGRNISFSLYPFSFREFLLFKDFEPSLDNLTSEKKGQIKKLFNEFFEKGGFPEYLQTEKEEYIKSVYENILYRDIVSRYKLPTERSLKETVYYAASNIGKEISFNSIRKLAGLTSATTIREYFEYLENSYLAFLIPRYSASLNNQIYSNKKVYLVDNGMVKLLGFRPSEDKGRILENIVFIELKRKGKEIFYHRDKYECDFIMRDGPRISQAIQVCYSLEADREVNGLLEAMEKYRLREGLILTDDTEKEISSGSKKIIVKPVWKWLLEDEQA